MHNSGCIICGAELQYSNDYFEIQCNVCSKTFTSNVKCSNNHYVCDSCHQFDAVDYIENYCKNSGESDPLKLIIEIMKNPKINMHGPEHHFLVPAVLLTCYYNILNKHELLNEKIAIAKERGQKIPGGFCGFYGNCGAGVGTGIFMSIINNATPLSKEEWRLSNLMTAKSLEQIANNGGPRCCKRDSFLAIETAVDFVENNLNVIMPKHKVKCEFYTMNKVCIKTDCKYFTVTTR